MEQFILKDNYGNDIHTYLYKPETKIKGVIQIVHGASEHFSRYGMFAKYLVKNHYLVVGNDILGHGLSTDNLDYVHFADKDGDKIAYESVVLIKDWIEDNYPKLPKYLLGHSMGSFIARKLVIDYPDDYKKAIFSGSAYPPKALLFFGKFLTNIIKIFKGKRYVSKLIQDMSIDGNQKKLRKDKIISGDNEEWLTRDKKIQEYYKHSKMCGQPFSLQANSDMFTWIQSANKTKNIKAGNYNQPIFFISGGHDALSNYGKEINKLAKKMNSIGYKNIKVKIYPEARHEVLNEINKDEVYQDILKFIEK
ncbi:MAG: alpha/beta hydrolase [Candidatus Izimaplasma sp.]|nr:alpha/beta hydrolase [Candidatus Izimaplasma bacterium]